jgi:hypothetical protein
VHGPLLEAIPWHFSSNISTGFDTSGCGFDNFASPGVLPRQRIPRHPALIRGPGVTLNLTQRAMATPSSDFVRAASGLG